MPGNVLLAEPDVLVWHTPPQRRPIWFKTRDTQFNSDVSGVKVWHPALLFIAQRSSLRVYALATHERPAAETPVYRAPYYNLGTNGVMCAGNTLLPETIFPSSIPKWEDCFFGTNFTHSNCSQEEITFKGAHNLFWRTMRTASQFCTAALRPAGVTLGELINP
jgi:PRTRC genetic system protein B